MRRIRAIEHDRTRRRPASEIRSEVWFATEEFECFLSTLQSVGASLENRSVPGCGEKSEWGGGSFTSDEDGTLQPVKKCAIFSLPSVLLPSQSDTVVTWQV